MLKSNVLTPGPVLVKYKGLELEGMLLSNGNFSTVSGKEEYTSTSSFALFMMQSINPTVRTVNGWSSIWYKGERLEDIRNRYKANGGIHYESSSSSSSSSHKKSHSVKVPIKLLAPRYLRPPAPPPSVINRHSTVRLLIRYTDNNNRSYKHKFQKVIQDEWIDVTTPHVDLRVAPHGSMYTPTAESRSSSSSSSSNLSTTDAVSVSEKMNQIQELKLNNIYVNFDESDAALVQLVLIDVMAGLCDDVQLSIDNDLQLQAEEVQRIKMEVAMAKRAETRKRNKLKKQANKNNTSTKRKSKITKKRPAFRYFCAKHRKLESFKLSNPQGTTEVVKKKALRNIYMALTEKEKA